jgi:hypothetical protein
MINQTAPGRLQAYLIGDLGPARRHLERIRTGVLQPTPGVLDEIEASIERCVERIQRDVPGPDATLLLQGDLDTTKLSKKEGV